MKKIEYVKPILQVDMFFKLADHLLKADDYELVQMGRTMRSTYEAQMIEIDIEEESERFQTDTKDIESYNPADCKSGACD